MCVTDLRGPSVSVMGAKAVLWTELRKVFLG